MYDTLTIIRVILYKLFPNYTLKAGFGVVRIEAIDFQTTDWTVVVGRRRKAIKRLILKKQKMICVATSSSFVSRAHSRVGGAGV